MAYETYGTGTNKMLNRNGSITTFSGTLVRNAVPEYQNRSPMKNEFLNPDGTTSTLQEILGSTGGSSADKGGWDASSNTPDYTTVLTDNGDFVTVTVAGTQTIGSTDITFAIRDRLFKTASGFQRVQAGDIDLSAIPENAVVKVEGGQLVASAISDEASAVHVSKTFETTPGTINVGPAVSLNEFGGLIKMISNYTDNEYLVVLYQETAGTISPISKSQPFYFEFGTETPANIQGDDSQTLTDVQSFIITSSANLNRIHSVRFNVVNALTNFRMRITNNANTKDVKYFPTRAAWESGTGGVANIGTGVQEIYPIDTDLYPDATPIIFPGSTAFTIDVMADQSISLLGNSLGIPFISVNQSAVTIEFLAKESETTGTAVRDKLVALPVGSKLPASAVEGIPQPTPPFDPASHSVTEFNDVSNAGGGVIPTTAQLTKLDGIEAGAQVNRTSEATFNLIKGYFIDGTNTQVTVDDASNTIQVNFVGTPPPPQALHTNYLDVTATNAADTVDINTAQSSDDLNPSFTIPTFTGNRYLQILQSQAHTAFTSIRISGVDQFGGFTVNENARTINGQAYRQFVSENLLTDAISGAPVVLGGAS